jgi:valyl-tRNA synthetase
MPKEIQNKLFPMDLRPQAHEIISFWLFNTVVKSRLHYNSNPWKNATISGFVTLQGEKMSKSRGNIIRPQEVMEKYGSDAIRYWASSSKLGEDFDYQEKDVITGKKFITKILNAANFIFKDFEYPEKEPKLIETDRIFISQLNKLIELATESFEEYNYSRAKLEVDGFFWRIFADYYLEIIKERYYQGNQEEKNSAKFTLYQSFLAILKMMAPITPFITEELYDKYFRKREGKKSIHLESWPEKIKIENKNDDDKVWQSLTNTIFFVRQEKSKAKKSMKSEIKLTIPAELLSMHEEILKDIKSVTCAKETSKGQLKVDFL